MLFFEIIFFYKNKRVKNEGEKLLKYFFDKL